MLGLWYLPIHLADRRVVSGPPAIQAPLDKYRTRQLPPVLSPPLCQRRRELHPPSFSPQPSEAPKLTLLFKSRSGPKR